MSGRSVFLACNLMVVLVNYTHGCEETDAFAKDAAATNKLHLIFNEERWTPARAMHRFQNEVLPELRKREDYDTVMVAQAFRDGFVRHLTTVQIALIPQLSLLNFSSLHKRLDWCFPSDLEPWQQFITRIGLLNHVEPDDATVKKAFEGVRRETSPQYNEYEEDVHAYLGGLIASNTLLEIESR